MSETASVGTLTCPTPDERPDLWPWSASREGGVLRVGGVDLTSVAADFGTPTFVLDVEAMRGRARVWASAMAEEFWDGYGMSGGDAFYAGKAFLSADVARLVAAEGLGIDTASLGELSLALRAGVDPSLIGLHGNNKSDAEIRLALEAGIHRIFIDSMDEVHQIERIAADLGVVAPVMARLKSGIHAGGNEYIATAHEDQKFGMSLQPGTAALAGLDEAELEHWGVEASDSYAALAAAILNVTDSLDFRGIHCHIGSQIFEAEGFEQTATTALEFMNRLNRDLDVTLPELDLGGGYGIAYTEADRPRSIAEVTESIAASVAATCERLGMAIPHMSFEPGRSISGPSGATLYTVGTIKNVSIEDENGEIRVRRYVSVDGGMSDNARPVLYESDYSVTLANRAPAGEQVLCRVVGKHCESGDIVVRYCYLPADLQAGDILAVPATGAYCYVLGSNYNFLTRPPVIATAEGRPSRVMIRRQSEDDMLALDMGSDI